MRYITILFSLAIFSTVANGQAKIRKLPNNINHPSINVYAPYMSFDANALLFLSDNNEDNALSINYTFKENADWKDPLVAPKNVNSKFNFLRGYALSADGKKMYFSSLKSPGVGGYDILSSDFKNGAWSEPVNLGVPINSKGNEATPSFTFDGNTMYFMRCDKMNAEKGEGCKLFVVKKKSTGQWDEPVEMPANINTGNSQTPRIMADGETLIFSSDKFQTKGGMDLLVTKLVNGNWNNPVPLDFANTDKDDQWVSVNALGRYLIKDAPGTRKNEIVEYLIPDVIRPRGMMKLSGTIKDQAGAVTPAYVSVTDLKSKKRIFNGRPAADGSILLYLMEGSKYELTVDPEQSEYSYFSKQFDLTSDKIPQGEKVSVVLKKVDVGDELPLDLVKFKDYSDDLDPACYDELKRLARIIKKSPQLKFEIQVLLSGYLEDSVKSSPDLTERIEESIQAKYDDIDSLGQLYKRDTLITRITYNNDRTLMQSQAVIDYLITQGIDAANLSSFGNAIAATLPENRKTVVKVAVRKK